ncbi:MAG: ATP-binding protein [Gemmatimonadales bacterium]
MPESYDSTDIIEIAARHRPRVIRLGRLTAAVTVAAGLLGAVGQVRRGAGDLAAEPFSPGRLAIAVAAMLLGAAIWLVIDRRRTAARALGGGALLAGILVLVGIATGAEGQPLVVAGAIVVLIASLGVVVLASAAPPTVGQAVLAVAGISLLALAGTVTGVRLAGILSQPEQAHFLANAMPLLGVGIGLGAFFLYVVLASELSGGQAPRWLAPAAGIAMVAVVLTVWVALLGRERQQVLAQTAQAVEAERLVLLREVESNTRAIERLADWASSGLPEDVLPERLGVVVRDLPGLVGGIWFPPSGPPLPVPPTIDTAGLEAALLDWRLDSLSPDPLGIFPLDSIPSRIAVIATGCNARGCGGAFVGVVDAGELFASAVADTSGGYHFGVIGRAGYLPGSPRPGPLAPWERRRELMVGGATWTVSAWPTTSALARLRSDLPAAVLFMGLVVAGLLPAALHFGQVARRNAQAVARARLSRGLDSATDGVWEMDLGTGQVTRSASLWRHLSYDPMRAGADRWFTLLHPDDRPRVEDALRRHLAGDSERFEAEYRLKAGDGSWHVIVDRGRIVERGPAGKPLRMLGISGDVTEASSAAAARAESERRFRAVFDSAFHFQFLLDLEGRILEVNRAALAIGNNNDTALKGRRITDTLWWAAHPEAAAELAEAIATTRERHAARLDQDIPGGPVLGLALSTVPDQTGVTSQILLEGRDETARRQAESALQEVSTLTTMGRLAARVAHEINNPLAGIQSAFLLIRDAIPADHPHARYVGAIEREIGRIGAVTRQLYETYRPETESTPQASVGTLVTDAAQLLGQLNKRTGVRIDVAISASVPAVVPLPSAMIRQIVFNLVQNAVDASPPEGLVSVRADAADGWLEIGVRDQGRGVPEAIRDRIFEPFFSTKDRGNQSSGMGLGLSLVKRGVTAIGGSIAIVDPEGGGTEFVVRLPLSPATGGSA